MSSVNIEKDIKYYVQILQKANIMETTDPFLCLSLLIKCIAIIDKNTAKFMEFYPDRRDDLKIIRNRVLYLRKKYGDRLSEDEKDFVTGTSFLSFINEAMERINFLASRFEYKKALTVILETKKIAKDYGLTEQIQILEAQEKLYKNEKNTYDKKVETLNKLSSEVVGYEKARRLPPIVITCEKIIPLAQETGKKDIVETFTEKKEKTQVQIVEQSAQLPLLIQRAQELENLGDFQAANVINGQIIEIAHQLDQNEIQQQYQTQKETLQTKIEMVNADQQTKLQVFITRLEHERKNELFSDAIYSCDQILEILPLIKHSEEIPKYELIKRDLQLKLQQQQENLKSQLQTFINKVESNKSFNIPVALDNVSKVLELASKLKDQLTFEKYNQIQTELRDKLKKHDSEFNLQLLELNTKLEQQLSKHKITEAIETCKESIAFVAMHNKSDLEIQFKNRLKELQGLNDQEKRILDSQIAQMEKNIDEQLKTNQEDTAIENMANLISLASKGHRLDIVAKYTSLRDQILGKNKTLDQKGNDEVERKNRIDNDAKSKLEKHNQDQIDLKRRQDELFRIQQEKELEIKKRQEELSRIQQQKEMEIKRRQEELQKQHDIELKNQDSVKKQRDLERQQFEAQIKTKMDENSSYAQKLKIKEQELAEREKSLISKEQALSQKESILNKKQQEMNVTTKVDSKSIQNTPPIKSIDEFSNGFIEILKQFGLTDSEIQLYLNSSQRVQTLPELAKAMKKSEKDPSFQEILKKLDQKGLLYQTSIENTSYYVAYPPYNVFEWLIQQFKVEINGLRNMQIAKLETEEGKKDKKGTQQVERLNDLLNSLSTLENSFNTDISDKENTLQSILKKLKEQDTAKRLERTKTDLNKLFTTYSNLLQNPNFDSSFFVVEGNEKNSLETLAVQKDLISIDLDVILNKIFSNLEKLQLGLIQRSVNNVIKTILSNEIEGLKNRFSNEIRNIIKNPIKKVMVSINNQFQNTLSKPILNTITENIEQIAAEGKNNADISEEIYTLFGKIVNEFSNSLKKAKSKATDLSGHVVQSVKSIQSPVKIEINEDFHKYLDQLDVRVQKCLHAIVDCKDALPPIIISTKSVETTEKNTEITLSSSSLSSVPVLDDSPKPVSNYEKPKSKIFSDKPKVPVFPKKAK